MRPMPPEFLKDCVFTTIVPAPEAWDWVKSEIIAEGGSIYNPAHEHLYDANIQVMWASISFRKQGRTVLGQAEKIMHRAGGWQKARMEQQMRDWFDDEPEFVITLAADYCSQCSDMEFCALVEHELFHIAHKLDKYGAPAFGEDGLPKLEMRGHDVEEFVGVVERYGANEGVQRLIDAASKPPEVARISIAKACGTCLLKLA